MNTNPDAACPMCPSSIRNLSATVHNLASRLEAYAQHADSPCKIIDKWKGVVSAAQSVALAEDAPEELKTLLAVAVDASKAETIQDLLTHTSALKSAAAAVGRLSSAHFANQQHSHGEATAHFRNQ